MYFTLTVFGKNYTSSFAYDQWKQGFVIDMTVEEASEFSAYLLDHTSNEKEMIKQVDVLYDDDSSFTQKVAPFSLFGHRQREEGESSRPPFVKEYTDKVMKVNALSDGVHVYDIKISRATGKPIYQKLQINVGEENWMTREEKGDAPGAERRVEPPVEIEPGAGAETEVAPDAYTIDADPEHGQRDEEGGTLFDEIEDLTEAIEEARHPIPKQYELIAEIGVLSRILDKKVKQLNRLSGR